MVLYCAAHGFCTDCTGCALLRTRRVFFRPEFRAGLRKSAWQVLKPAGACIVSGDKEKPGAEDPARPTDLVAFMQNLRRYVNANPEKRQVVAAVQYIFGVMKDRQKGEKVPRENMLAAIELSEAVFDELGIDYFGWD